MFHLNLNFHNHLSQSRLNGIANFHPSLSTESTSPQAPGDPYLYPDISPGQVTLQPAALQQPKSCPAPPLANQPKDSPGSLSKGTKWKHFKKSNNSDKYISTNTSEANLEPKFQQSTNFNIHVDKYLYVHYLSYRSTGDWGASDPSRALPFNFPAPNPHLRQLPPAQVLGEEPTVRKSYEVYPGTLCQANMTIENS